MRFLSTSGRKLLAPALAAGAVMLVMATAAVGHGGVYPGVLHLGHTNASSAVTTLTGTVANKMLQVTNNSTGSSARAIAATSKSPSAGTVLATNTGGGPALALQVDSGVPPMKVGSATRVQNFNADRLDGKSSGDFVPTQSYVVHEQVTILPSGESYGGVYCDTGDRVQSGGYYGLNLPNTRVRDDYPPHQQMWAVTVINSSSASGSWFYVYALCADYAPYHVETTSQAASALDDR